MMQILYIILTVYTIIFLMVRVYCIPQIDMIVAKDGTGNYSTITDAVAGTPNFSNRRFYIKIKQGNYTENVVVGAEKTNITFIGEGIDKTIISGNKSFGGGFQTYYTATAAIEGFGFMAMDITFENTAGALNGQAVALRSNVESGFYRCKFSGFQDTLNPQWDRQFYRECEIHGTIDFIFGNATVVFQNCAIYVHLPLQGQSTTITAQEKTDPDCNSGTIIHNCSIVAADDFPKDGSVKSYLGRPWKNYSMTVVMQSYIDNIIDPSGWLEWTDNSTNVGTIFYAEYQNRGPGSATNERVQWAGYHVINRTEALQFTVENFILGNEWLPSMEIPFFSDVFD